MKINKIIKSILVVATLSIGFVSCTKYVDPPLVFEDDDTQIKSQRKVLVISIDGVTGAELLKITTPRLEELKKTGKYNYNVLNSIVANDVASWATMATGTSFIKHQIKEDSFLPAPTGGQHDEQAVFRNVFDYILQYKSIKTAVITPWMPLRNYLRVADLAPIVQSDLATKDSTVNILAKEANIGAVMVNFKDVVAAGANGGFVANNDAYKNAILKADEYVGNIVDALKSRASYAREDWLVIVTTNHGGSGDTPTPGFIIASQKDLKPEEMKKAGFNTVRFAGNAVLATVPNDNGLYDGGATKDFTVQFQVKYNSQTSYPAIISKGTGISGGTQTGWLLFESGANITSSWGGTANASGVGRSQINVAPIGADRSWHTVTFTVKTVNATTRTVTTYQDGIQVATGNIANHKSLQALNEPLKIGFNQVDGSGSGDFYMANLQYFNTALSATVISDNISLKDVTKHPNYTNLIGFWPIDEGAESILNNKAPGGYNMVLSGPYTWTALGTDVPSGTVADANATGKSVLNTTGDVTATMLYWLNINILPEFKIDGTPFLSKFEVEFLK